MKSLLAVLPNMKDATSFYRGMGPLSRLREVVPDLNVNLVGDVNWAVMNAMDVVFMQRPYKPGNLELIEMARRGGKPVWLDYDDDLLRLPKSNPMHALYAQPGTMETVAKLIARADFVTVSTAHLANQLEPLNKNIMVIPNAIDEKLFSDTARSKPIRYADPATGEIKQATIADREPLVWWRGSKTHDKDLWEYTQALSAVTRQFPKVTFAFQGDPFWLTLEKLGKNHIKIDAEDPLIYMDTIRTLRPMAFQTPLHDCDFNRSKSNIAWIEASWAGAVSVVPAWDEWKQPGAVTYRNPDEFMQALRFVLSLSPAKAHELADQSWKQVCEKYTLAVTNRLRKQVLERLGCA